MNDLIEFLRARLDEDEQLARESEGAWISLGPNPGDGRPIARLMRRHAPARVLAEIDAKRRILDLIVLNTDGEPLYRDGAVELWEDALKLLALPHSRHPDYSERWRP